MTATAVAPASERLSPRDRLEQLSDPGSMRVILTGVMSRALGSRARAGDGVVVALARLDGRPVVCYAQDGTFLGGSLGEAQAASILRALALAERARVPVIGFVESAGARLQEGVHSLAGYARLFRKTVELSNQVPQISVVSGTSAGGGSYSPALTDFVIMTRSANMFLTGPRVVQQVTGEEVSTQDLGGARVHSRNGVCHFTAEDEPDAGELVRKLLGYLPQHFSERPLEVDSIPPEDGDPAGVLPADSRGAYDVRDVAVRIADGDSVLEVWPRWARNMVTAFARIDGRPVGIVANQPRHLGGVIDSSASQKGARFIRLCNRFGLPLVVLVDTPGFLPGERQEVAGIIRHGAELLHAFAEATVPKTTIVLRKAYGGAYITMNCKGLGADLTLAWPDTEIGIMGAPQAVRLVHRRELQGLDETDALIDELAASYSEEHLRGEVVAGMGEIDELIYPSETRDRVAEALEVFSRYHGRRRRAGDA